MNDLYLNEKKVKFLFKNWQKSVIYDLAYNRQNRENLVSANEDMVGEIGSITKTFTALMIMKLIEEEEESGWENKIRLDTYVEDILTPDVWPEDLVRGRQMEKK